jgi:hypothetical protein
LMQAFKPNVLIQVQEVEGQPKTCRTVSKDQRQSVGAVLPFFSPHVLNIITWF